MNKKLWIVISLILLAVVATVAIRFSAAPQASEATPPAALPASPAGGPALKQPANQPTSAPAVASEVPASPSDSLAPLATPVVIQNFAFNPPVIQIKKGGSVTWTNRDNVLHNAILNDGSGSTPLLSAGQSAILRFDNAGSFSYRCGPHPWMTGTVIVE